MNTFTLPASWADAVVAPRAAPELAQAATGPDRAGLGLVQTLQSPGAMTSLGLLLSLAVVAAPSLLIAVLFWQHGAPFVLLFSGLEVLALAAAFVIHGRHAGDGESLHWDHDRLRVELRRGRSVRHIDFSPAWLHLRDGSEGTLVLRGQGHEVVVGRHVRPRARRQAVEEVRHALADWRATRIGAR